MNQVRRDVVTNMTGQQVTTAKVQHGISSTARLTIKLTNKTASDISDLPIFPGYKGKRLFTAKNYGNPGVQGVDVEFVAEGFTDIDDFCDYYKEAKVLIEGGRLSTTDTDNYVGELIHREINPTGKDTKEARYDIEEFRVNMGTGFQKEMKIAPSKMKMVLSRALSIHLSRLVANSSIEFTFNVSGYEKSAEISGIDANVIN